MANTTREDSARSELSVIPTGARATAWWVLTFFEVLFLDVKRGAHNLVCEYYKNLFKIEAVRPSIQSAVGSSWLMMMTMWKFINTTLRTPRFTTWCSWRHRFFSARRAARICNNLLDKISTSSSSFLSTFLVLVLNEFSSKQFSWSVASQSIVIKLLLRFEIFNFARKSNTCCPNKLVNQIKKTESRASLENHARRKVFFTSWKIISKMFSRGRSRGRRKNLFVVDIEAPYYDFVDILRTSLECWIIESFTNNLSST